MAVETPICDFGWQAPDFALPATDGKTYALGDIRGAKGTLVMFICNHCPYVKAVIDRIVRDAAALQVAGIGMAAICAHRLVEQGRLDLDAPVAEYWPEFATKGKEHATVRMLLDHSVGLAALRTPVKPGGWADFDYMCDLMADEEPFWRPGTRNGYHMYGDPWKEQRYWGD